MPFKHSTFPTTQSATHHQLCAQSARETRATWENAVSPRETASSALVFHDLALHHSRLITAYPEAKVILVERPVDRWMASFGGLIIDKAFFGLSGLVMCDLGLWLGRPMFFIVRDIVMGWLQADSRMAVWKRLPIAHREHSAMVRSMVPADQLLEFKLEDGWEPLCQFFDVAVPEVPFPHINDRAELTVFLNLVRKAVIYAIGQRVGCLTLAVGAVGAVGITQRQGAVQWMVNAGSGFGLFCELRK